MAFETRKFGRRYFDEQEAGNVGLGQGGCIFEDGTDAVSGEQITAIQFVTDSTFTTLTPEDSSFIGTSGGNGDSVSGNTFPTGMVIFGRWTGFTLATGSVVAYLG